MTDLWTLCGSYYRSSNHWTFPNIRNANGDVLTCVASTENGAVMKVLNAFRDGYTRVNS